MVVMSSTLIFFIPMGYSCIWMNFNKFSYSFSTYKSMAKNIIFLTFKALRKVTFGVGLTFLNGAGKMDFSWQFCGSIGKCVDFLNGTKCGKNPFFMVVRWNPGKVWYRNRFKALGKAFVRAVTLKALRKRDFSNVSKGRERGFFSRSLEVLGNMCFFPKLLKRWESIEPSEKLSWSQIGQCLDFHCLIVGKTFPLLFYTFHDVFWPVGKHSLL